ncbi:MAG: hypothetical protein HeimC2_44290 [Candidatus Heimdallarchaeota archaeon LC_2]|nr:MAG: hypothetical protein HeimC2_44290 [Candidatus Heimdallarchaeota archaeon LC_2]
MPRKKIHDNPAEKQKAYRARKKRENYSGLFEVGAPSGTELFSVKDRLIDPSDTKNKQRRMKSKGGLKYSINTTYQRLYLKKFDSKFKNGIIETIFKGMLIPPVLIVTRKIKEHESVTEIVDGQQRLRTIVDFLKDRFEIEARHAPALKEYDGKVFGDLPNWLQTEFEQYIIGFSRIAISSELTDPIDQDIIIREIFERVNRSAGDLNPIEKFNAKYGASNFFFALRDLAFQEFWLKFVELSDANEEKQEANTSRMQNLDYLFRYSIFLEIENKTNLSYEELLTEFIEGKNDVYNEIPLPDITKKLSNLLKRHINITEKIFGDWRLKSIKVPDEDLKVDTKKVKITASVICHQSYIVAHLLKDYSLRFINNNSTLISTAYYDIYYQIRNKTYAQTHFKRGGKPAAWLEQSKSIYSEIKSILDLKQSDQKDILFDMILKDDLVEKKMMKCSICSNLILHTNDAILDQQGRKRLIHRYCYVNYLSENDENFVTSVKRVLIDDNSIADFFE